MFNMKMNKFITKSIRKIINLTAFLIIGTSLHSATPDTTYIRQNCGGTSNCYASLNSWQSDKIANNLTNLVSLNKIEVVVIDGAWTVTETNPLTIDGWTTDAGHYIKISTSTQARHNGKWSNTDFRMKITNSFAIEIKESNVIIDGIQVSMLGSNTWKYAIFSTNALSNIEIKNNIIKD